MENDELLFLAALDNLGGSSVEFCFDLIDNWNYEGREQRKDKHIQLIYVSLVFKLNDGDGSGYLRDIGNV